MKRIFFLLVIMLAFSFTANAQSSTEANSEVQKIKVFPNPATNVVNILGLKNSTKAYINISDTWGNSVLKHHWAIKNNALNIPISSLNSGVYIVTIRSQTQHVQTKFYKK